MLNKYRIYLKGQSIGFTVYAESIELDDTELICFLTNNEYTCFISPALVQSIMDWKAREYIYTAPVETLESVIS